MRRAHKTIIIVLVVLLALVAAPFGYYHVVLLGWHPLGWPDEVVTSVQVGDKTVRFYIDYSWDFACFGYFVKDGAWRRRYFPLQGSVHRGLERMTVDVFLSETREEMWVRMGPPEEWSYFRADNDFIAAHGYDATWPEKFDREISERPPLPPDAEKVLSFVVGEDHWR